MTVCWLNSTSWIHLMTIIDFQLQYRPIVMNDLANFLCVQIHLPKCCVKLIEITHWVFESSCFYLVNGYCKFNTIVFVSINYKQLISSMTFSTLFFCTSKNFSIGNLIIVRQQFEFLHTLILNGSRQKCLKCPFVVTVYSITLSIDAE